MIAKNVLNEIRGLTNQLIEDGLADEFRIAKSDGFTVSWEKCKDLAHAMKNMPYKDIYNGINKERNFNFKLLDGGIFQLLYNFDKEGLLKHRLAYFPSPYFEEFQNNPEIYEYDDLYGDIINKQVMPVIVRIDYDRCDIESEYHHPYCHVTLGQYKNCRIPVESPLTPCEFVSFILENFYYVPSKNFLKSNFKKYVNNKEAHIHNDDLTKIYLKTI